MPPTRYAVICAAIATLALGLAAAPALAEKFDLDASQPPLQLCTTVQKNVRFLHNVWDNGARDTFAQIKTYIGEQLTGKSEAEGKLLKIYQEIIGRIEGGDYSEPKMTHAVGNITARNNAGTLCLQAFPSDGQPARRAPLTSPVPRD